jgi:hypothetical protein
MPIAAMSSEPSQSPYYRDDADFMEYLDPTGRVAATFEILGVQALNESEARQIQFNSLFEVCEESEQGSIAVPTSNSNCVALPGTLDDHTKLSAPGIGLNLRELVEAITQKWMPSPIYIICANRRKIRAHRASYFSYAMLRHSIRDYLSQDSFIVFSPGSQAQICYHDDLEVMLISSRGDLGGPFFGQGEAARWGYFFDQNFSDLIAFRESHLECFNKYFQPRLHGVSVQTFCARPKAE